MLEFDPDASDHFGLTALDRGILDHAQANLRLPGGDIENDSPG